MRKLSLTAVVLLGLSLPGWAQVVNFQKEFPYRSLLAWQPGMRFRVQAADAGFDCPLMALKGATFTGTDLYGVSPDDDKLAGQVFTFQRLDAFRDRGHDGKDTGSGTEQVAVVFKAPSGKQYAHVINTPLAKLKSGESPVGAPCLVLLDDVEKAQKVLVGRTFFVLEQYIGAGSTRDDVQYLPKFVPVKITKAAAGTGRLPVRLKFEYVGTGQVQEHDYVLSGTNAAHTFLNGELLPEAFQRCFSATDPRAAAGVAKDTYWKAIQQGVLVKGMSMKDVELAMGKPKRKAESMEEERMTAWYYSRFQGKEWELLFRNGLLERYANYQN
jgi:hypothetical protein